MKSLKSITEMFPIQNTVMEEIYIQNTDGNVLSVLKEIETKIELLATKYNCKKEEIIYNSFTQYDEVQVLCPKNELTEIEKEDYLKKLNKLKEKSIAIVKDNYKNSIQSIELHKKRIEEIDAHILLITWMKEGFWIWNKKKKKEILIKEFKNKIILGDAGHIDTANEFIANMGYQRYSDDFMYIDHYLGMDFEFEIKKRRKFNLYKEST